MQLSKAIPYEGANYLFPVYVDAEIMDYLDNVFSTNDIDSARDGLDPNNSYWFNSDLNVICLNDRNTLSPITPFPIEFQKFSIVFPDTASVQTIAAVISTIQSKIPELSDYKLKTNNDRTLTLPKDHPKYGRLEIYLNKMDQ